MVTRPWQTCQPLSGQPAADFMLAPLDDTLHSLIPKLYHIQVTASITSVHGILMPVHCFKTNPSARTGTTGLACTHSPVTH
jgi:hypothetical protein